jgi:hypothetical protein
VSALNQISDPSSTQEENEIQIVYRYRYRMQDTGLRIQDTGYMIHVFVCLFTILPHQLQFNFMISSLLILLQIPVENFKYIAFLYLCVCVGAQPNLRPKFNTGGKWDTDSILIQIQDTGFRIQDTGYRIQDTGYRIHVCVCVFTILPYQLQFNFMISSLLILLQIPIENFKYIAFLYLCVCV